MGAICFYSAYLYEWGWNEKEKRWKKLNVLLTIKKIGINGEGIGYYKKKITFVKGALPDEVIVCEIVEETPKYIIGKLVKVKEPSPHRVESKKNLVKVEHMV